MAEDLFLCRACRAKPTLNTTRVEKCSRCRRTGPCRPFQILPNYHVPRCIPCITENGRLCAKCRKPRTKPQRRR